MTEIERIGNCERVRVYFKSGRSKSFSGVIEIEINHAWKPVYMRITAGLPDGWIEEVKIPYNNIDYYTLDMSPNKQAENKIN